jgi:hypothetical protein
LEELGEKGRIILNLIFKKKYRVVKWIDLAQDRNKWRAIVNTVINPGIP